MTTPIKRARLRGKIFMNFRKTIRSNRGWTRRLRQGIFDVRSSLERVRGISVGVFLLVLIALAPRE